MHKIYLADIKGDNVHERELTEGLNENLAAHEAGQARELRRILK